MHFFEEICEVSEQNWLSFDCGMVFGVMKRAKDMRNHTNVQQYTRTYAYAYIAYQQTYVFYNLNETPSFRTHCRNMDKIYAFYFDNYIEKSFFSRSLTRLLAYFVFASNQMSKWKYMNTQSFACRSSFKLQTKLKC